MNGRSLGGHVRAATLSAARRTEIAQNAARTRWEAGTRGAKPLTSAQLRAIINKIERHKAAIAAHRDALRDIKLLTELLAEGPRDRAGASSTGRVVHFDTTRNEAVAFTINTPIVMFEEKDYDGHRRNVVRLLDRDFTVTNEEWAALLDRLEPKEG